MKHGPIALIDSSFPTLALAPEDGSYEKIMSNIQEIRARDGQILAVTTEGNTKLDALVDDVITVPRGHENRDPAAQRRASPAFRLPLRRAARLRRRSAAQFGQKRDRLNDDGCERPPSRHEAQILKRETPQIKERRDA